MSMRWSRIFGRLSTHEFVILLVCCDENLVVASFGSSSKLWRWQKEGGPVTLDLMAVLESVE